MPKYDPETRMHRDVKDEGKRTFGPKDRRIGFKVTETELVNLKRIIEHAGVLQSVWLDYAVLSFLARVEPVPSESEMHVYRNWHRLPNASLVVSHRLAPSIHARLEKAGVRMACKLGTLMRFILIREGGETLLQPSAAERRRLREEDYSKRVRAPPRHIPTATELIGYLPDGFYNKS